MSKGSYWVQAPFNAPGEPVTRLEIEESGPHWQKVREMRWGLPQGVHKFRSKREVAMAVLLWEIREAYAQRRSEDYPADYTREQIEEWFQEQARMQVIIDRIDEILTMHAEACR